MDAYTVRKDFKDALDPTEPFEFVGLPELVGVGGQVKEDEKPKEEVKLTLFQTTAMEKRKKPYWFRWIRYNLKCVWYELLFSPGGGGLLWRIRCLWVRGID